MPSENLHILCRFIEICPHFCEQYQTLLNAKVFEGAKDRCKGIANEHGEIFTRLKEIGNSPRTPEESTEQNELVSKTHAFELEVLDEMISSLRQNPPEQFKALVTVYRDLIQKHDQNHQVKDAAKLAINAFFLRGAGPQITALSVASPKDSPTFIQLSKQMQTHVNAWLEGKPVPDDIAQRLNQIQSLLLIDK